MGKERQRGEPEKVRQTERNGDSRETEDEKWRDVTRGEKVGGETHRGRKTWSDVDKRHLRTGREKDRETETGRDGGPKAEPPAPEVGHTDKQPWGEEKWG